MKKKLSLMAMSTLVLAFGLVVMGCPAEDAPDPAPSSLTGTWKAEKTGIEFSFYETGGLVYIPASFIGDSNLKAGLGIYSFSLAPGVKDDRQYKFELTWTGDTHPFIDAEDKTGDHITANPGYSYQSGKASLWWFHGGNVDYSFYKQ